MLKTLRQKKKSKKIECRSKPPQGGLEVNPQLMRSETKRRR